MSSSADSFADVVLCGQGTVFSSLYNFLSSSNVAFPCALLQIRSPFLFPLIQAPPMRRGSTGSSLPPPCCSFEGRGRPLILLCLFLFLEPALFPRGQRLIVAFPFVSRSLFLLVYNRTVSLSFLFSEIFPGVLSQLSSLAAQCPPRVPPPSTTICCLPFFFKNGTRS